MRRVLKHVFVLVAVLSMFPTPANACIACANRGGDVFDDIRYEMDVQRVEIGNIRIQYKAFATPKPPPPPPPPPTPRPRPVSKVTGDDIWMKLRNCESSDGRSSPNGLYHGYFQFRMDTWRRAGGTGHPMDHSYEHQKKIAQSWLARTSWAQWPACSRKLGLR